MGKLDIGSADNFNGFDNIDKSISEVFSEVPG